jgi:hypothetical protein
LRDRPARRLKVEHRDLRGQQGAFHPLPFARHLAFEQRDQDSHRGEDAGRQIRDRDADAHRPLARQPGDRHQPAHALRDLIEPGSFTIRTVLAEAGDRAIHQPLVDRLQRLIVDPQPELHVRPEILHQHIGPGDQPLQDRHPLRRL